MSDFRIADERLYGQYLLHLDYNYKDKVVLDIGAEVGTSADFFLKRGARYVWCIEGDPQEAALCKNNIDKYFPDKAFAVCFWIDSPYGFERLFSAYGATSSLPSDIIKIDIEGWECCLLDMNDDIMAAQKEYIIDTHSKLLTKLISEKLVRNGFVILKDNIGDVIHAVKRDPNRAD
uniref:Methyltransferase n=1 Tax=viral metagenome TaxID=1070528 RepID=A0A6H1ZPR2_9ZZZZ